MSIRNNIPNSITCVNLVCGAMACVAAFHLNETWWWGLKGYQAAYVLIGIAAIADFLDGLVARAIGAVSAIGKELDSLCDLVSFGLAFSFSPWDPFAAGHPAKDFVLAGSNNIFQHVFTSIFLIFTPV